MTPRRRSHRAGGLHGLSDRPDGGEPATPAQDYPRFPGLGSAVRSLQPGAGVLDYRLSTSLACARLGWAPDHVAVLSATETPLEAVRAALAPRRRILVPAGSCTAPAQLTSLLIGAGYQDARVAVLELLGTAQETRTECSAADWGDAECDPAAVVAITCPPRPQDVLLGRAPGLPDEAYGHDGQLTKAEMRAVSVAALRPLPGQLLWDVGGGAGSIGIEWCRCEPTARALAVEVRPDRAVRIAENAAALGVASAVRVVQGRAPEALSGLETPDAIFVGGGVSAPGLLDACRRALGPGGRLVANAVTVEGESTLASARTRHGGSIRRITVSRSSTVGRYHGWKTLAPVTQWVLVVDDVAVCPEGGP